MAATRLDRPASVESARLPRSTHIAYSLGAVATGAYGTAPSLLLLFFMTDTLGIAPAVAALGLFVVKAWDIGIDPLIGAISDRTRTRWGRRRPFMLAGAVLLGITLSMLFWVPDFATPSARFWWVLVMFVITSTAFSLYSVPYIAMPAEMTTSYHERTRMMSYRMAFMSIGVLVAGGVAPMVRDLAGGGRTGYAVMSVALAAICSAFMLASVAGTRRVRFTEHTNSDLPMRDQLALAVSNRPLVMLILTFLLQMSGIGALVALLPYFVSYILVQPGSVFTLGFVVLTVTSVLAMPVWVRVARQRGKAQPYAIALLIFAAMNLAMVLLSSTVPLLAFYALITVMGVGFAGTQLFPFAMLPDAIDHDVARSGLRREGAVSGVWIATEGVGMALGGLLAGVVLDVFGFVESTTGQAVQPASAVLGIRLGFSALPAAMILAALIVLKTTKEFAHTGAAHRP
jgi:GPH family glycoside/pentoside/hexuronide:cation symporter